MHAPARAYASLVEAFEAQVDRAPVACAVVSIADGTSWSYATLDHAANAVAHALVEAGLQPGDNVAIGLARSPFAIAAILGVLKAGAAYVPIDPSYPRERVAFMLEDSGARLVVGDTSSLALEAFAPLGAPGRLDATRLAPSACRLSSAMAGRRSESAAYVMYTSGSSGTPKGVVVEHGGVLNYVTAFASRLRIGPGDRVLQFGTLSFDLSVEEIFGTLLAGATLVLRDEAILATTETFCRACEAHAITVVDLPTAYWRELTIALDGGVALPRGLRACVIGGENADRESLARWRRHVAADVSLMNTYGPTEATIVATWHVIGGAAAPDRGADRVDANVDDMPIGVPVPNAYAYVVDGAGALVDDESVGELWIGGAGVARGYANDPALTAAKFVPNPFGPGRVYRTGDRVRRRRDGLLAFVGRVDDQVKVRGHRVEIPEIEARLRGYPGVLEAAVLLEGGRLHAWVAARGGVAADGLRAWLHERLPSPMVPSTFVVVASLPLTASGKTDRQAIRAAAASIASSPSAWPRSPTETTLCALLAEVLAIAEVGPDASIFDLGVHSLLATRFVTLARERHGYDVDLRLVFDATTVGAVAHEVARRPRLAKELPIAGRRRCVS